MTGLPVTKTVGSKSAKGSPIGVHLRMTVPSQLQVEWAVGIRPGEAPVVGTNAKNQAAHDTEITGEYCVIIGSLGYKRQVEKEGVLFSTNKSCSKTHMFCAKSLRPRWTWDGPTLSLEFEVECWNSRRIC